MRWQMVLGVMASLGFAARAAADALVHLDDALLPLDDDVLLLPATAGADG